MTSWGAWLLWISQGDPSDWLWVQTVQIHPSFGWRLLSFVSSKEQVTERRALVGEREGGMRFSSNCAVCQYQHLLTRKIDFNIHETWLLHRHKAWVSVGSGIQWKGAIFVDGIVNTKEEAYDGYKSYDFSTPTVLPSPLVWMWLYLFVWLNIYGILLKTRIKMIQN